MLVVPFHKLDKAEKIVTDLLRKKNIFIEVKKLAKIAGSKKSFGLEKGSVCLFYMIGMVYQIAQIKGKFRWTGRLRMMN